MCVDDGLVLKMFGVCFWQVVDLDISNTFVYLDGNVAPITGYDIRVASIVNMKSFLNFKVWEMRVNLSTTQSWLLRTPLIFLCS